MGKLNLFVSKTRRENRKRTTGGKTGHEAHPIQNAPGFTTYFLKSSKGGEKRKQNNKIDKK